MRQKIINFVKSHYTHMPEVYNSPLFDINIDFYLDNDRIALVVDKDDNITDIGMARTIEDMSQAHNTFIHVEGAHILSIDFIKVTSNNGVNYLWKQMEDRFPDVKFTTFERLIKGDDRLHMMPIGRTKRLLGLFGRKA